MSTEYGPSQRELLDTRAADLYHEAVDEGSILPSDPRFAQDHPDSAALELLVDMGLLALEPLMGAYVAVDPASVQSRVVAPMGHRAAELLNESTRWASSFSTLGQMFRRTAQGSSPITELRGIANINRFIQAAVGDANEELLTAQPDGARPAVELERALERDVRALQRGLSMRTLYQHTARRSVVTREYVARIQQYGAEVRSADEFFNRLIVIDRMLAIVPGTEGKHVAIAIHEPNLIAYLVDVFERYWERARDFADREEGTVRDVADDVHNMTVRMLVEGHSDNASAKRVGVSTRTYAAYVAALKDEFGSQTRFQLGYAMGLRAAARGESPPPVRRPDRS